MDSFAARLKQALEAWQKRERTAGRRHSQGAFADAIRVERNTVQGWLNRGVVPRDPVVRAAVAQALDVTWPWLAGENEQEPEPAATTLPRVMGGLPFEVRVWLQHELLDYAKAGVTDEELRAARDLYERPEVFTFYAGGVPKARTEDEVLMGMRAMAAVVRATLRRRGYKLAADTPF